MKTFTNEDLRKFRPCYDPNKHLKEDGVFTVIDILDHKDIPFEDKLWVILRTDFVSERTMRLFAVWSYRQTLEWVKEPDQRSIEAANVAERFANNEATQEELSAARSAAESAAMSAESSESAAWSAAWSAASAARNAASAAYSAYSAAMSAAESAARSAAESARSAARSAQKNKLKEMILNGEKTGDTF